MLSNEITIIDGYKLAKSLLPQKLWDFSRKSISDWKNIYFDECTKYSKFTECGGMFKSSFKKHSNYIKAFNYLNKMPLNINPLKLIIIKNIQISYLYN